jgi:cobalt-zinc-cadmium efflux system outer membrane protein
MRFLNVALALVLAVAPIPGARAQDPPASNALTLAEAMRLAETAHPAVRAQEARLSAAEGARQEADRALFNNPSLGMELTRRRFDPIDVKANEWNLGVAQPFETGGQQARRREVADAALGSLRAEIDEARRLARADAAQHFSAVLAAKLRVRLEQESLTLFETSARAVAKRREAGEDTRLDANVALIEAERSRNALAVSNELLSDARSELAAVLQLPPGALPDAAGQLEMPPRGTPGYDLAQLLASAKELPKLRALAAREDATRARLGLEHARRSPDVTVGVAVGREGANDARENIATLLVSVPLPLFNRNDAAIGQAMSEATQAEIDRATALRDTQAQVRQLWRRLLSQRERLERLQQAVGGAYVDNQQLAAKSRQAGQIGLLDQLLINRQTLDAERDLNDALAEFHATRIKLESAAGWPL